MTESTKGKQTMRLVLNKCFGGFQLSNEAYEWLIKNKGWKVTTYTKDGRGYVNEKAQLVKADRSSLGHKYWLVNDKADIEFRTSHDLIAVVEALGDKVNTNVSRLQIIEVPKNVVNPYIDEYDGVETLREGRSW